MIYIGRHVTTKLEDGYLGSGKRLKRAIAEFGKENFKRDVLFIYDNPEEMFAKEIELVNDEFRNREDTYNWAIGSNSWGMLGIKLEPRSPEYIEKQRIAHKGKKRKPLSAEHKAKISEKLKGRPSPNIGKTASDETKQKMSESQTGRTHSPDTIKKLVDLNTGENNPMFGKTASDETRIKMSNSHKGKPLGPQKPEHTEKIRQQNLGRKLGPHSKEHREKLRQAKLGKPRSESTKEKIRQTNLKKSFEKRMQIINSIINSLIIHKSI